MNPFGLDASGLLIWGLVVHLVADWLLQNGWMAQNKMKRRERKPKPGSVGKVTSVHPDDPRRVSVSLGPFPGPWYDRHPAAYVHAGIHGALLALVFGWVAAPLALAHLVIDCRWPVEKWSKLIGQTQPAGRLAHVMPTAEEAAEQARAVEQGSLRPKVAAPLYDIGTEVRFWSDQVFHIACISVAALAVAA